MTEIRDLELLKNLDIIYNNKIILYGAGDCGHKALEILERLEIPVLGICDTNQKKRKHGVSSIRKFFGDIRTGNTVIIITIINTEYIEQVLDTLGSYGISEARCYTYFALRHTIELHIEDKRIPETYRKEHIIKKKIYRTQWMAYHELAGLSMICNVILDNGALLLLQPGKVGSSSIAGSLENVQVPYLHAHTLTDLHVHTLADSLWGNGALKERLLEGVKLFPKVVGPIKIISMIRDPIGRDVSAYFQAFMEYTLYDWVQADVYKGINDYIDSNSKIGDWGWIFEWFNIEIKNNFGIDIYQYDFDKKRGCQIIKKDNVELLLIKTEKLNCCQDVVKQFVGRENFKLVNANMGNDKLYKYAYTETKKTIVISDHIIDFYYNGNKGMDHFYTLEEKRKFAEKWCEKSGTRR